MEPDVWLIAGLGNPGPAYARNRHNVGFLVLDVLADRMGARFKRAKTRADIVEGRLAGSRAVLAKPHSYMNESGGPVAATRTFFSVPPERVVVVHDELDIPFGAVRLKRGGGDNGHNGLRSITASVGTRNYCRIRVGIGRPPGRMDPADFVLRNFAGPERADLALLLDRAADAVETLLSHGLERAQNAFHADAR